MAILVLESRLPGSIFRLRIFGGEPFQNSIGLLEEIRAVLS